MAENKKQHLKFFFCLFLLTGKSRRGGGCALFVRVCCLRAGTLAVEDKASPSDQCLSALQELKSRQRGPSGSPNKTERE